MINNLLAGRTASTTLIIFSCAFVYMCIRQPQKKGLVAVDDKTIAEGSYGPPLSIIGKEGFGTTFKIHHQDQVKD